MLSTLFLLLLALTCVFLTSSTVASHAEALPTGGDAHLSDATGEDEIDADGDDNDDGDEVPMALVDTIECPACDYTAGFVVKQALEAHRQCGRKPLAEFTPAVFTGNKDGGNNQQKHANGFEDSAAGIDADGCATFVHTYAADGVEAGKLFRTIVAAKRTIGAIYDRACTDAVMRAFPVGSRAAPRETDEDTRPDDQRIRDLTLFVPEPADAKFKRAITTSCDRSFGGKALKFASKRKAMKRFLYELTVTSAGDGLAWDEVDAQHGGVGTATGPTLYARRNEDYQKIVKFQEKICASACGDFARPHLASPNPPITANKKDDLVERPEKPKKTADEGVSYIGMVSWNALGEIISREHI